MLVADVDILNPQKEFNNFIKTRGCGGDRKYDGQRKGQEEEGQTTKGTKRVQEASQK